LKNDNVKKVSLVTIFDGSSTNTKPVDSDDHTKPVNDLDNLSVGNTASSDETEDSEITTDNSITDTTTMESEKMRMYIPATEYDEEDVTLKQFEDQLSAQIAQLTESSPYPSKSTNRGGKKQSVIMGFI
jgi:hypothetical protein